MGALRGAEVFIHMIQREKLGENRKSSPLIGGRIPHASGLKPVPLFMGLICLAAPESLIELVNKPYRMFQIRNTNLRSFYFIC